MTAGVFLFCRDVLMIKEYIKERIQALKLSPLVGESVSGADERGKCEQTCEMILTCVRKLAPIASQARHFPPCSGEADTKEKRNYSFYL